MLKTLQAALLFYTSFPIPTSSNLDFGGIAVYAPLVGIILGGILASLDWGLGQVLVGKANLLQASLVVLAGIGLTGGLHLDGVIDSADGLAVTDPAKRLAVMSDSQTGAYGVMAAIALILLKVSSLVAIGENRAWILISVSAWGRWAQLFAIQYFPYLKAEGKGKFHQAGVAAWQVWLVGGCLGTGCGLAGLLLNQIWLGFWLAAIGFGMAIATGSWFQRQLGGQTGDTYGAIVEWTEAFALVAIALLAARGNLFSN